jgi:hypothetical protein
MAAPTEVELLRQAIQLQIQCSDYLAEAETAQRERWELLRRVIEDAGKQYSAMRLDAVEERQMDEGAPLWFSVILTVAVSFIPLHALTVRFLEGMTEHTQNLLTRKLAAELKAVSESRPRELDINRLMIKGQKVNDLLVKIKNTEEKVEKYLKLHEPDVHHGLVSLAHALGEEVHKKKEKEPKKTGGTDAPIVAVTQAMHTWIDSVVRAEDTARRQYRKNIRDLFDIATAKDPAKEAKNKEAEAAQKEAEREPRVPLRRPVEKLPTTSKDALQELSSLREQLTPPPIVDPRITEANDLRDLQLMIESIIWVSTYDFTPEPISHPSKLALSIEPASLPQGLWKRLIERYIDPDEGKTYKEVGEINRLGTKQHAYEERYKYPPELRLSHYFSQELYPKVKNENAEIFQKFRTL